MQEFNKISTTSNFIKNLLLDTYLPLIRTVRDEDYIIKDRLYIYKCNIIKCTKSGYLVTGYYYENFKKERAQFAMLEEYFFGDRNDKLCTNFLSNREGYDYLTHERLGKYLRSVRDMYGLNLMPLYNCFSNQIFPNHRITSEKVIKTSENYNTKIYKIPIRFNTTYTLCMENLGMTTIAPAFIKHNNLVVLNNTRFGNSVDVTNKYIRLHREGVLINRSGLRFRDPIYIRYDNIPKVKQVSYPIMKSKIIAKDDICHDDSYFEVIEIIPEKGAKGYFERTIDESGVPTYIEWEYRDDGPKVHDAEDKKNVILVRNADSPKVRVVAGTILGKVYRSVNPSTGKFDTRSPIYISVNLKYRCNESSAYMEGVSYYRFINWKYVKATDITKENFEQHKLELYYNLGFIDDYRTYYYLNDENKYVPNTSQEVDMNKSYAQLQEDAGVPWLEEVIDEETGEKKLVNSTDTYIDLNKDYYSPHKQEEIAYYDYNITEENCALYDYQEENLYLLIQVPSSLNPSIVLLEGEYHTDTPRKLYDKHMIQYFPPHIMDKLFTSNLKLMTTETSFPIPFSDTLIEFLTWNAISKMDSINNDMDRLRIAVQHFYPYEFAKYHGNYWYPEYRRFISEIGNLDTTKYTSDNLGYVTKDIEKILYAMPNGEAAINGVNFKE